MNFSLHSTYNSETNFLQGELMTFPQELKDHSKDNYIQKCIYMVNLFKDKNQALWEELKAKLETIKPEDSWNFFHELVEAYKPYANATAMVTEAKASAKKAVKNVVKKAKEVEKKVTKTVAKAVAKKPAKKAAKKVAKKAPAKKAAKKAAKKVAKKAPAKKAAAKKVVKKKAAKKKK